VLGIVVRNGSGVMLYRDAVDPQPQPLSQEGRDEIKEVDVRCSICVRVRIWVSLDL